MSFGQYSLMELVSVGVGTFPSEEGRNSIIFYWVFTGGFKDGLSESVIALSTLYSIHYTEHWTGCTLYWSPHLSPHCTLTMYTIQCTVHSSQSAVHLYMYIVHCTLHRCTLLTHLLNCSSSHSLQMLNCQTCLFSPLQPFVMRNGRFRNTQILNIQG